MLTSVNRCFPECEHTCLQSNPRAFQVAGADGCYLLQHAVDGNTQKPSSILVLSLLLQLESLHLALNTKRDNSQLYSAGSMIVEVISG